MPGLRERFDARARRILMLAGYALALAGLALAVLIVVLVELTSKSDDKLAIVANWLAAGTLMLAFLAGFVALQAYANASGQPDLKVRFNIVPTPIDPSKTQWATKITLTVRNDSLYAAKSPGVLLQLEGMAIENQALRPGWSMLELMTVGTTPLQWDSQVPIHGRTTRDIYLDSVRLAEWPGSGRELVAVVKLMADGYEPREVRFPVPFQDGRPVPRVLPGPGSWA